MNNSLYKFIHIRALLLNRFLQFPSADYQELNTTKLFLISLRDIDLETVVTLLAICDKRVLTGYGCDN